MRRPVAPAGLCSSSRRHWLTAAVRSVGGLLASGPRAGIGLASIGLAGCAAVQSGALLAEPPADLDPAVELTATPFFPQTAYQCGPAALATALGAIGIDAEPERLAAQVFLPARQGSLQVEMIGGARRAHAVPTRIPAKLESLLREVAAGHVVVVLQNLGLDIAPVWHYAVVVGYSLPQRVVVLRSGVTQREVLPLSVFEHTWSRAGSWGFVALAAGHWPVSAEAPAVVEACIGFERAAPPGLSQRAYASAVQRWPGNLALTMGLGNTSFEVGDKVLAADSFETAARQHRNAAAWINLARTLLAAGLPASAWRAALEAEYLDDPRWRSETTALLRDARAALRGSGRLG